MSKIILYTAASLNMKIAKNDGSIDWLESIPNPDKLDYGYSEFYSSIESTIMGFKTYKQISDWDIEFPYKEKCNYIITQKTSHSENPFVNFIIENHINTIKKIKSTAKKNIWLIGGGTVNTLLLNNNLIDEIILFIMPLIIKDGIDLFEGTPKDCRFEIINSESYSNSVTQIHYKILK